MLGTNDNPLSVSELNGLIKEKLISLGKGYFEGEVSSCNQRGKTAYVDIRGGDHAIEAVTWNFPGLKIKPEVGKTYIFYFDKIDQWKTGKLKVNIKNVYLSREGELQQLKDELIKELTEKNLVEKNKLLPLPFMPAGVGLITGNKAMAFNDVVTSIDTRCPMTKIYSLPTLVQGVQAPDDLVTSIKHMEALREVEVIVLARGGGSNDDLAAFDSRDVCMAIVNCSKPVVTAVGHTDDMQVCNLVANAFVNTPSRIGELLFPITINDYNAKLIDGIQLTAEKIEQEIFYIKEKVNMEGVLDQLGIRISVTKNEFKKLLEEATVMIENKYDLTYNKAKMLAQEFEQIKRQLVKVIDVNDKPIASVNGVKQGDEIKILFPDGKIISKVEGIIKNGK